MPLPKPSGGGQTQSEFVSSCMASKRMQSEFPDQKQRVATCYSLWKRHLKNKRKTEADDHGRSGEEWEPAPLGSWDEVASDIEKTKTVKTEDKTHLILPDVNPVWFVDPKGDKAPAVPKKTAPFQIYYDKNKA